MERKRAGEREKKHKSKQTKQSTTINYFIMMILNKVLVWMCVCMCVHWSHLRCAHFDLICHTKKSQAHTHTLKHTRMLRHTLNFYGIGSFGKRENEEESKRFSVLHSGGKNFYCVREKKWLCVRGEPFRFIFAVFILILIFVLNSLWGGWCVSEPPTQPVCLLFELFRIRYARMQSPRFSSPLLLS